MRTHGFDRAWREDIDEWIAPEIVVKGRRYHARCQCGWHYCKYLDAEQVPNMQHLAEIYEAMKTDVLRKLAQHVIEDAWLPLFEDRPHELRKAR